MEITLALGGGGIKGHAHVGVLRVLEREGIGIKAIAGTSAGGLLGGLYAAGYPLEVILIRPNVPRLGLLDKVDVHDLARRGEFAAQAALPEIYAATRWHNRLNRSLAHTFLGSSAKKYVK